MKSFKKELLHSIPSLPFSFYKFLLASVFFTTATGSLNANSTPKLPVVLVHGAWQADYVWKEIAANLEKEGYRVSVVSLPGHGSDQTPAYKVSFQDYINEVKKAINKYNDPVILVGHSLGGAVITQTAAELPGKIAKLIYVAGYIPLPGKSVLDYSMMDTASLLPAALQLSADQTLAGVKEPEVNLTNIFAQDANATQKKFLVDQYKAEPTIPMGTPLNYTKESFEAAGLKYYVFTTADNTITFPFQQRMATEAGITNTFRIDSGHSPFISKSGELEKILRQIIQN